MKLMRVMQGCVLHDPQGVGMRKAWLFANEVIDVDDAWVASEIRGQEYKLEPATDSTEATSKALWPGPLFARWARAMEAQEKTEQPAVVEQATLEPKRRGRRKKAEDEL